MIPPELVWIVTLVSHGNARLRGQPCPCPLFAERSAEAPGVGEWLESLGEPGARRLWVTSFATRGGPPRWGLEVERENGSEVWIARARSGCLDLERLLWEVPAAGRTHVLAQAEQRLRDALSAWASPPPLREPSPHLFPDTGYLPDAARLFATAWGVLRAVDGPGAEEENLRGAALGALLAAVHA